MIRLGACLDLLDPYNVRYLEEFFHSYRSVMEAYGQSLPKNVMHRKYLDCAIFEYAYTAIGTSEGRNVDTCRGVYVPAGPVPDREGGRKNRRVWDTAWIMRDAHIQICVRNEECILGTWLVQPSSEEIDGA